MVFNWQVNKSNLYKLYKWLRAEEKLLVSHCFLSLRFVCCLYPCFVQIVSSPAKLGTTCAALNVLLYLCCFKCKYISYEIDIYDILEEVDRSLIEKISSLPGHPLYPSVPKTKESSERLRVPSSHLPRVNTQSFKNSFFNRPVFKYRFAIYCGFAIHCGSWILNSILLHGIF